MPITIDDLSQKLGLSRSTISKALNNRFDVAPETRERVQQAAAEYGYQPSAAARNLRLQKTEKIGLVFNYPIHKVSDFLAELLPGMASAAEQAQYNLILYTSMAGTPDKIEKLCRSREVDGIVLVWPPRLTQTLEIAELMQREKMPYIVLPRRVPHPDVSFVAADHTTGARLLTEHLIELGHQRIGFASRPEVFETDTDRREGYRQALEAANIPYDEALIIETDSAIPNNAELAFDAYLAMPNPPSAILFFTDPMAIAALKYAREKGIRVPDDIAIAGYDGVLASGATQPSLTTVRQPLPEIGQVAVEALLQHIADDTLPPSQHILPVHLVVRQSTALN